MRSLRHVAVLVVLAAPILATGLRAEVAAPAADTMAAAADLFEVMFERAFAQANAQAVAIAWPAIESDLRRHNPRIEGATLTELRREYQQIRLARLREVLKDVPSIYARHLTAEDMRVVADFYRTPAGTRMMRAIPLILSEAFAAGLPRVQALSGDTNEIFVKILRERGLL